jgi:hypothetical protein
MSGPELRALPLRATRNGARYGGAHLLAACSEPPARLDLSRFLVIALCVLLERIPIIGDGSILVASSLVDRGLAFMGAISLFVLPACTNRRTRYELGRALGFKRDS